MKHIITLCNQNKNPMERCYDWLQFKYHFFYALKILQMFRRLNSLAETEHNLINHVKKWCFFSG